MKTIIGATAFFVLLGSAVVAAQVPDIVYGDENDIRDARLAEAAIPLPVMAPKIFVQSVSRIEPTAQQADQQGFQLAAIRRCERRAFEVNDFGKEGPISLAKKDLANYVEQIKKREGVRTVRVSQKKPVCTLYLWLGPASEYTCRIEASICW